MAYKELATFPSECEAWKRLLQSVVNFKCGRLFFKFQVSSSKVWKKVLQVFEAFNVEV
jgi:hypothetical protein